MVTGRGTCGSAIDGGGLLGATRTARGAQGHRPGVAPAARRSAWSARAAAESRRWPASSPGCIPTTGGSVDDAGQDIATLERRRSGARCAGRCSWSSRIRSASLNPRRRVGAIIGDPFRLHGVAERRADASGSVQRSDGARRAQPGALQPVSLGVLRRPAAAHRHRPRAGPQSGADHLRRAGLGARRLDPGPGAQPAALAADASSTSPTSSSRTISRWSGTSATASPSCTSGTIVELRRCRDALSPPRSSRTPGPCWRLAGAAARSARPASIAVCIAGSTAADAASHPISPRPNPRSCSAARSR